MKYPTLYKRTVSGAIQIWYQEIEGDKYRSVSGQLDGKHVISGWHLCEAKNEGRSNSTTPELQAIAQVESNYKKRKEVGYWDNVDHIDNPIFFKPMLAATYDKMTDKRMFSQPKLDGMRCVLTDSSMTSRGGKAIVTAPHIHAVLQASNVFERYPNVVFDGELYNHDLKDNFNELMSLAKKTKPSADDLVASSTGLQYWVYDIIDLDRPELTFSERFDLLQEIMKDIPKVSIKLVQTDLVSTESEIDELNARYLEEGYEGQILRLDRKYENKRTKSLLKRKEFLDEEFTIVEIQEGNGNRAGMAGRVICALANGATFGAGIKGGEKFYIELLKDAEKYKGGQVTIKHFIKTPDGVPRFPVATAFYEDGRDI